MRLGEEGEQGGHDGQGSTSEWRSSLLGASADRASAVLSHASLGLFVPLTLSLAPVLQRGSERNPMVGLAHSCRAEL